MAQNEITATFSVGGMPSESKVSYPLPPDPHAAPGYPEPASDEAANMADIGLNESVEVGCDCTIADYGFGGSAGGGNKRNTKD